MADHDRRVVVTTTLGASILATWSSRGVGNTFGSEESLRSLLHDVRAKLFDRRPDETWFHPATATPPE